MITNNNLITREKEELQGDKLEFQISDWNFYHELDNDEEQRYVIQLFGRTEDDKDVCLKVTEFMPFFYVEIPEKWGRMHIEIFINVLKSRVKYKSEKYNYDISNSLIQYKEIKKYKFQNFNNRKEFRFLLLVFKSYTAMQLFSNTLAYPLRISELTTQPTIYQRYESNIEPHIRFMHMRNISSCGWIIIEKTKMKHIPNYSNCDLSYQVNWQYIEPSENDNRIAPFKIMGYDIECVSCDENFPQANRKKDKIIQIGITMYRYGSMICYDQHILALKGCAKINGVNVECYATEKELLEAFARKIAELRPDFKAGYNNFGFDDKYIWERIKRIDKITEQKSDYNFEIDNLSVKILGIMGKLNYSYLKEWEQIPISLTKFEVKNLSSSALGDNELSFFQVPGIVSIDMMKVIQREHKLIGYKLDNVSANFITEKVEKFTKSRDNDLNYIYIYTVSTKALEKNSFIQIMIDDGYSPSPLCENARYKVLDIETIIDKGEKEIEYQTIKILFTKTEISNLKEAMTNPILKVFWTFAKDDMHHSLIKKYFNERDPIQLRRVAKYCLKDCKLVNLLLTKLEIIVNSIGMAKVCNVPLSYLFLRGQGVKIFSLVAKKCRLKNFLIPVLIKTNLNLDNDFTYEGATVITPKPGVYLSPIAVLDYNALYPKSMCERNLSHECYVKDSKYDNLSNYRYHNIDIVIKDKGRTVYNIDGTKKIERHRFAQELDSNGNPVYGILPEILTELLDQRKVTNEKIKTTNDAFLKAILNSLQIAYKITANSLYGQTGAPTSPIFFLPIAASTTAIGRERLYFAKKIVEENFDKAEVIYGDTDSIFINFHIKDDNGKDRTDKEALIKTIVLAKKAANIINDKLPKPQCIVYEKTFHPLILIAKKKYVGLLFEENPDKYYLKSMGIVLKRRDNAPIVKIVIGGIINYILKNRDLDKAIKYTKQEIRKLMDGKYSIDKFIISKTLKAKYKKPSTIAHKVLADRIALRDPGNKPQINDRIPYVYVVKKLSKKQKKTALQGDLIETPDYVIENELKIDYLYYLTNRIIKPVTQILERLMLSKEVEKLYKIFINEEEGKRIGRRNLGDWMMENKDKTILQEDWDDFE